MDGLIDMRTSEARKHFESATKPVCDPLYDMSNKGINVFLGCMRRRVQAFGWDKPGTGIVMIPENPTDPLSPRLNLLYSYGQLPREVVSAYAATYITSQTRQNQDDVQMYECLWSSLSEKAHRKLALRTNNFTVLNRRSGILLLKTIISEARMDSNATSAMARLALSNVREHMCTIEDRNIVEFNDYVRSHIETLDSKGEISTDLIVHLFKGYAQARDKEFVSYMKDRETEWQRGTVRMSWEDVMELAEEKYKLMMSEGTWQRMSETDEQIVLLQSQVESMTRGQRGNTRGSLRAERGKRSRRRTREYEVDDGVRVTYRDRSNERQYNYAPTKKQVTNWNDCPDWFTKNIPPKDPTEVKTLDGFDLHYCGEITGGRCERWRRHTGAQCRKNRFPSKTTSGKKGPASALGKFKRDDRKKKITVAMNAEIDDDDDVNAADDASDNDDDEDDAEYDSNTSSTDEDNA